MLQDSYIISVSKNRNALGILSECCVDKQNVHLMYELGHIMFIYRALYNINKTVYHPMFRNATMYMYVFLSTWIWSVRPARIA